MHVTIDAREMREHMAQWRRVLSIKAGDGGPTARERAQMLTGASGAVKGWVELLTLCRPDDGDAANLQQITREVACFSAWLEEARAALRLLEYAKRV